MYAFKKADDHMKKLYTSPSWPWEGWLPSLVYPAASVCVIATLAVSCVSELTKMMSYSKQMLKLISY